MKLHLQLSEISKKHFVKNIIFVFISLFFIHQNVFAQSYFNIYTDAETRVKDKWVDKGTLTEQTGAGAVEGVKDYNFTFTTVSWVAGFGLNLDNWGADPQLDVSGYQSLEVSYKGPSAGDGIYLRLVDDLNAESAIVNLPYSAGYSTVLIPFSDFGTFNFAKLKAINFGVTGIENGTGNFQLDNIRFTTIVAASEINVKAGTTSVASSGTYDFGSVVAGNSGSVITFTIENSGNIALTIAGSPYITISGTDQAMFAIDQTSTSNNIAVSGSTTFTITFSPTSAGSKSAAILITNNDSDEGSYTINLTGTGTTSTGTINALSSDNYSIFPNPVTNTLNVSLDGISGEVKLNVRNQLGTLVEQLSTQVIGGNATCEVSLTELPSGIYFVEIISGSGTVTKKIIKR